MRLTILCPAAHIPDANHLAMVLGYGPADALTYGEPTWQDAGGNLYAAASFEAPPEWITAAQSPLSRPAWDAEPYTVNMAGAERAQAALVFFVSDGETPPPQASTDALTAIGGMDGTDALAAMGLARVDAEQ